jgi:hypothetical protein
VFCCSGELSVLLVWFCSVAGGVTSVGAWLSFDIVCSLFGLKLSIGDGACKSEYTECRFIHAYGLSFLNLVMQCLTELDVFF